MPTESARVPKENPPPVLGAGSWHKEGKWWGGEDRDRRGTGKRQRTREKELTATDGTQEAVKCGRTQSCNWQNMKACFPAPN